MKSKDLIKEMEAAGWVLARVKGSHHQFNHEEFGHSLTVPHPKEDLPKGTVNTIRKSAGLK